MTTAWDDNSRIPDPDITQGRYGRRRWIKWVGAVVVVLLIVMVVGSYIALRVAFAELGKAMNDSFATDFDNALSGGTAANAAADIAASQPPGSLSASTLNSLVPRYQWVDGSTSVPYSSSKRRIVAVEVQETHITTAVQPTPNTCSFGLVVTSSSDPVIAADSLPGPGTYWAVPIAANTSVGLPPCATDQAPTSSWMPWDPGLVAGP